MNIFVHAFWYTYGFIALGNIPRFGIAESRLYVYLVLVRTAKYFCKGFDPIYIGTSNVYV